MLVAMERIEEGNATGALAAPEKVEQSLDRMIARRDSGTPGVPPEPQQRIGDRGLKRLQRRYAPPSAPTSEPSGSSEETPTPLDQAMRGTHNR